MSTISEQERFQEPEDDSLERWPREKADRREEPQRRERRLDTAQPTLDESIGASRSGLPLSMSL